MSYFQKGETRVEIKDILVENRMLPEVDDHLLHSDLITLSILQIHPRHPAFPGTVTTLQVDLHFLKLNFIPDAVLYLLSLSRTHHQSASMPSPKEEEEQMSLSSQEESHSSLSFSLQLASLQLNLYHRVSHSLTNSFQVSSGSFSLLLNPN